MGSVPITAVAGHPGTTPEPSGGGPVLAAAARICFELPHTEGGAGGGGKPPAAIVTPTASLLRAGHHGDG